MIRWYWYTPCYWSCCLIDNFQLRKRCQPKIFGCLVCLVSICFQYCVKSPKHPFHTWSSPKKMGYHFKLPKWESNDTQPWFRPFWTSPTKYCMSDLNSSHILSICSFTHWWNHLVHPQKKVPKHHVGLSLPLKAVLPQISARQTDGLFPHPSRFRCFHAEQCDQRTITLGTMIFGAVLQANCSTELFFALKHFGQLILDWLNT